MGDKTRGLYEKFTVIRNDGKSALGQKHHGCFYFVLDCDHDPHAKAALEAYAKSCESEYPPLASDVRAIVEGCAFGSGDDRRVTDALDIRPAPEMGCEHGAKPPFTCPQCLAITVASWPASAPETLALCPHGKPADDTEHQCGKCGPVESG